MTNRGGRAVVVAILGAAVLAGAGLWYLQVYGYYSRLDPAAALPLTAVDGTLGATAVGDFQGIDGASSPIRWRACFTLAPEAAAAAAPYPAATPLIGPGWFPCYDARALGADLAAGRATAILGQADIRPDVDRVYAVYPDGRAFGWHQYLDKTPDRGVMD